jgi:hypothetical protein
MGPASRQDVQNMVNIVQNRLMDRVAAKQDIIAVADSLRALTTMQQQSLQLMKQNEYQQSQLTRRIVALEARLGGVENEIRETQYAIARLSGQKPQQVIMPVQTEEQATNQQGQYVYRPTNT